MTGGGLTGGGLTGGVAVKSRSTTIGSAGTAQRDVSLRNAERGRIRGARGARHSHLRVGRKPELDRPDGDGELAAEVDVPLAGRLPEHELVVAVALLEQELLDALGTARQRQVERRRGHRAGTADQSQQALQRHERRLLRKVVAQHSEVVLGAGQAGIGLLVDQLVRVGAADPRAEVLEVGAEQVVGADLLGDRRLSLRGVERVVVSGLGGEERLGPRDDGLEVRLRLQVRRRRRLPARVGVHVAEVQRGVEAAQLGPVVAETTVGPATGRLWRTGSALAFW